MLLPIVLQRYRKKHIKLDFYQNNQLAKKNFFIQKKVLPLRLNYKKIIFINSIKIQ